MQTKQNKTTAIIRRPKQFSLRLFFTAMIPFLYFIPVNISVLAQNFSQEISPCYESAQARYSCFIEERKGEFERAKEIEAIRRTARDTKEEFLLLSLMLFPKRQCENYLLDIM